MSTIQQINVEEIQKKLANTLSKTAWYNVLNHFITKSEFQEIVEKLIYEVEQGKRFVPKINGI